MCEPDHIYTRPLYKLLDSEFPQFRNRSGALDAYKLAIHCNVSFDCVYKTIHRGRISKRFAKKLISGANHGNFAKKIEKFVA